jgi:hypothetical protein
VRIPQPGDFFLGQIQGRTVAGRTRRWVELGQWIIDDTSQYSHAGCVIDGGRIIEAMPGGARIGWLDALAKPVAFSSWDLTEEQRTQLVITARAFEGVPYSFLDYGALALHAHGLDSAWLRDYIDDTGHMICSQLVDHWYTTNGLHPFQDGRWPGYVTPGDLNRALDGPVT